MRCRCGPIEFTINAISNRFKPYETLSEFATEGGPVSSVKFAPKGNTALFDQNKQIVTANARIGVGVISYSTDKPFETFQFRHQQHPRNIGFAITNVKATPVPVKCS